MKNYFLKGLFACMSISLVMFSCSNEDFSQYDEKSCEKEIKVFTDMKTRNGMNIEALKKKQFYLYIDQTDEALTDYFVLMKYEGENWKAYSAEDKNTPVALVTKGEQLEAKIAALFYDCETISKYDFLSEMCLYLLDYSNQNLNTDMLYASNTSTESGGGILGQGTVTVNGYEITIAFNHIMSQLQVDLNDVAEVHSIVFNGLKNKFNWNASTNAGYSLLDEKVEMNVYNGETETMIENEDASFSPIDLYIAPGAQNFDVKVVYTMKEGGKSFEATYNLSHEFVSGNKYEVTLPCFDGGSTVSEVIKTLGAIDPATWADGEENSSKFEILN